MDQVSATVHPSPKRIIFIDALRAYAILMMLQGHFVDTLLADVYRNPESLIFSTWSFMRGLTAPIFFTASGLIFVFLLLKDGRPLKTNIRFKKGLRRGFFLVVLGYLLKWNLSALLFFKFYKSFITLDVLHSIGIAILTLIGAYALYKTIKLSFPVLLGSIGLGIFLVYPAMQNTDWSHLPLFFQNYVTRDNGSVFTPIPWVGYTMLGGLLGWHLHVRPNWYQTAWSGIPICILGLLLHRYSDQALYALHGITGLQVIGNLASNHWVFWRLGHVFITISLFIWISQIFYRYIPPLFLTIGSETLTIYSVHYVVLYGTWTGIGIKQVLGERSLSPWEVAIGAVLFVAAFVLMIYKITDIRAWIDREMTQRFKFALRYSKAKATRYFNNRAQVLKKIRSTPSKSR